MAVSQRKRFGYPPIAHIALDAIVIAASLYLSLYLRVSGDDDKSLHFQTLNNFALIFVVIRLITMNFSGTYKSIWRYSTMYDFIQILKAVVTSSVLFFAASYLLMPKLGFLPRSVFLIDVFIATAGLCGIRILSRLYHERQKTIEGKSAHTRRLIIFGAGENGRSLASRLKNDPNIPQHLVGFVDDDPKKLGKVIAGVPVLGTLDELEKIIESYDIEEVFVSINHAPGDLVRKVVEKTRPFNIVPNIFTHFQDRTNGNQNILRPVSLYDLLSRKPAAIDHSSIKSMVEGRTVLVTGAGGSIGSELARQLYGYNPKKLVLLDHSEFNLYNIDKELRLDTTNKDKITPVLLDIKDFTSLEKVFAEHTPDLVYHAAAYKHVHLVEMNSHSAILNNIQGTLNLLELCEKYKTSTFLNISTDKAVNPVGTMGSTKRVCELLTSLYGLKTSRPYSSVRFGNVLGSSGSLIPLLQTQIQNGGPLTITHPEMKRYFMLIPEAVSLVLMSSELANPGDINVLNMGEQVKILDLAKSLLNLSGKTENDIEIIFTGIRPGEKMYEEMYISGSEIKTTHPDVLTLPQSFNVEHLIKIKNQILGLIEFSQSHDDRALTLLAALAKVQKPEDVTAPAYLN